MNKFLGIITGIILLIPTSSFAAIAIDNSAYLGSDSTNVSTTTANFTVTGSNTLVILAIAYSQTVVTTCPVSVTYNGASMTETESAGTQINNSTFVCLWYILGQSGTHPFVVTKGVALDSVFLKAASYTGVAQTGQPDAHGASATTGTTATVNLTTVANNTWILSTGGSQVNGVFDSTTANMVLRVSNFQANYYDSNAAITPAGSKTVTGTDSTNGGNKIGLVAASFSPISAAAPTSPFGNYYIFWW